MCLAWYSLCTYTNFQAVDTRVDEKEHGVNHIAELLGWRAPALNGTLQLLSSRVWICCLNNKGTHAGIVYFWYVAGRFYDIVRILLTSKQVCFSLAQNMRVCWVKTKIKKITLKQMQFSLRQALRLSDACHLTCRGEAGLLTGREI